MAHSGGTLNKRWIIQLSLTVICFGLGTMIVVQLRTQYAARQAVRREDWSFVAADLIDSNARLREEIESLETQLADLQDIEQGRAVLQSLVDEVNYLRIVNGWIEVSGPGIEVLISGPINVLDLHDLVNELRNAGAETLALNGRRIVAWSAISTDGEHVTVDGLPVHPPYHLQAIGEIQTLEGALLRPGGLIHLLRRINASLSITVHRQEKLTLSIYDQPFQFAYARRAD
jgi:uncharacterized protein YlxW (UPF0749 family)